MQRTKISFMWPLTIFFITALGFSQVSLEIQNVDASAGTLDIYMTNEAGCSSCSDTSQGNPEACSTNGGTWVFDNTTDETNCTASNGQYFSGVVGGFQFEITNITVDSSSAPTGFTVSNSPTTVLGFSLTGATIPVGAAVLTTVSFSGYDGSSEICFGEDTGTAGNTLISAADGSYIATNWGDCATLSIYQTNSMLPQEFSIFQNFPNPFNPATSITFDVAKMDEISIIVYDIAGKEVATLASGTYTPGSYMVEWNAVSNQGHDIASGMYIYRYISSENDLTRKMLYLK